jgi:ferredoxin
MKGAGVETVFAGIRRIGLVPRGALELEDGERTGALAGVRMIVLAGMAGRDGWSAFAASPEARDGADHPLDRWSRRVIEALARELGAKAFFPFGGPPFWPFQQWARRAESVHPSPIGLLIHPRYGLWHSYRGALGFYEKLAVPEPPAVPSPCESCSGRWCLSACPVGAFSAAGYDVAACVGHLKSAAGADCMAAGCLARRACPVGAEHAYGPEQAHFFMRAFLRGQGRR